MSVSDANVDATQHETADELAIKYKNQIHGKTIVITGTSPYSIGAAFVSAVARASPEAIVLVSSSAERIAQTIEEAKANGPTVIYHSVVVDLASLGSVRKAASEIDELVPKIDALILNAGVMATPFGLTEEGVETQFGVNHVGHFLFANLLVPKVVAAGPGSRVVVVSSAGHRFSPLILDDFTFSNGESYNKWKAYGNSKTANCLYALELADRLKPSGIQAFSVHPGRIFTGRVENGKITSGLGKYMTVEDLTTMGVKVKQNEDGTGSWEVENAGIGSKSIPQGASTHVFAAFAPEIADQTGSYCTNVRISNDDACDWAKDHGAAKSLWEASEKIVGQKFDF